MAVADSPTGAQTPDLGAEGLDRGMGFFGLLWASETSIIGSGWLFGAFGAAVLAGPSALLGWVLGSIIILVLALVHAELGGLFPVSGGTSRFPHYAFGSFAGATFGWASYLQAASVAPAQVNDMSIPTSLVPRRGRVREGRLLHRRCRGPDPRRERPATHSHRCLTCSHRYLTGTTGTSRPVEEGCRPAAGLSVRIRGVRRQEREG